MNTVYTTPNAADILADLQQQISARRIVLPGVPELAVRIREAAADEDGSAERIASLIGEDPALSAHIIKVSNSAWQWRGQQARSVRTAVLRLGFRLTATTATSFCILQMLSLAGGQLARVRTVYANSLAVGERCFVLAHRYRDLIPEDALLAGLVHDIGMLVLLRYVSQRPQLRKEPALLEQLLRELHPAAGAALLREWRFPEPLVSAVAEHEAWFRGAPTDAPDYADLLIAANLDLFRDSAEQQTRLGGQRVPALIRLRLDPRIPLAAQSSPELQVSARRLCGLPEPA
jgi:HD-like signal output (HDOD) protein